MRQPLVAGNWKMNGNAASAATLLAGINDGDDELDGIVRLLAGKRAIMNMIPYNAVEGLGFARPADERSAAIARQLHQRGVLTKLRQSAGQDIDGGCGQLRARQTLLPRPAGVQRVVWRSPG